MFLRSIQRRKDDKEHRYWSIVENRRGANGRVIQRQVSLFPADREAPELSHEVVHLRLDQLQVKRPRQWGACWPACELWQQLRLDEFWGPRLLPSREGTDFLDILTTLVSYRLIDPGSEWRHHRKWYHRSAMGDLLGRTGEAIELHSLYRCLDKLLEHKPGLLSFLTDRSGPQPGPETERARHAPPPTEEESRASCRSRAKAPTPTPPHRKARSRLRPWHGTSAPAVPGEDGSARQARAGSRKPSGSP